MPFLGLIKPKLTTVRIAQFEAGRAAADLLIQLLNRGNEGRTATEMVLPVEVVVRESTAPVEGA